MPRCNTVGYGGGGKSTRQNKPPLLFSPFISSFGPQFVLWPALGMLGFLTIDYLLVIKATPCCKDWKSVSFLPERCLHKLFVAKFIFDIKMHILQIDFCMLLWPCLWKKWPDQSTKGGWTWIYFSPWLPEKSVFRKMFLIVMQSMETSKHNHSNHCWQLTLVSKEARY